MWNTGWRERIWADIHQPWDLVIIGGGITGAGIFNLACRHGLKPLLLEASDFAFGTSSRSSKLAHGGFRYLRNRQFSVTRESVRERERLLREAPNLVTPLPFLLPAYHNSHREDWLFRTGVVIYDLMAPKWQHRHFSPRRALKECSLLNPKGLTGGCLYYDAAVDDARLVIRALREGVARGGTALNYAAVSGQLRDRSGQVRGVAVSDRAGEHCAEVTAPVVINATGPWSDDLRQGLGGARHIRKLRGSHLVFSRERLPLAQAVALLHPRDHRALFAIPWDGVTLIGTTDHDHHAAADEVEPVISPEEVRYLLEAGNFAFPSLALGEQDVVATFAGLRPTIDPGSGVSPSKVSRAPALWKEEGLITITGGKLTIYRRMALQALRAAAPAIKTAPRFDERIPLFDRLPEPPADLPVAAADWLYQAGRYGAETLDRLLDSPPDELAHIAGLPALWAELRWAAANEGVVHLDDLLLRRVRLGLTLADGGLGDMARIEAIVRPLLGWDETRWQDEVERYTGILNRYYPRSQPVGAPSRVINS